MVLDELGKSLRDAITKLMGRTTADEAAIKEFVKEIQRALLRADVNVALVLDISQRIEKAASQEIPPGVSRKDQIIYSAYNELIRILGEAPVEPKIERGRTNTYMLVGIQGSGKTTTAAKLAYFYQKKGLRTGVICSDTYRPGALQQLIQLLQPYNIPVYEEEDGKDPIKITLHGLEKLKDECNLIIIDTAGRHKDEKALLNEIEELSREIKPDRILLTIDATMGQQAGVQAKAFHEAVGLGYIIISKMDGAARGGGALSAVAATGAPIVFIGVGEKIGELEHFDPTRFVSRLLGYGDLKGLVERFSQIEIELSREKAKALASGRFTLDDMLEQLEAASKIGPIDNLLKFFPGRFKIPEDALKDADQKIKRWKAIVQSMNREERNNPNIVNSQRARRVAKGSGTSEKDVKELIKQFNMAKSLMRKFRGSRELRRRMLGQV
ncbi:MAG: signal recognition particle receptor subunit alpha [Thermoproteota archaeon]